MARTVRRGAQTRDQRIEDTLAGLKPAAYTGINIDWMRCPIERLPPSCFIAAGSNALIDIFRVSWRRDGLDGEPDAVPLFDDSSTSFVAVFEVVLGPDWRPHLVTAFFKMSMNAITIHQNGLRGRGSGRYAGCCVSLEATLMAREADGCAGWNQGLAIQEEVDQPEAAP